MGSKIPPITQDEKKPQKVSSEYPMDASQIIQNYNKHSLTRHEVQRTGEVELTATRFEDNSGIVSIENEIYQIQSKERLTLNPVIDATNQEELQL